MKRRSVLHAVLAAAAGIVGSRAAGATEAGEPSAAKVAYHLADLEKVAFVLGNIRNHVRGMGGPDKVTIELVVHGPALKAFHAAAAEPDIRSAVAEFSAKRVAFSACANTMAGQRVTLADLLPGFGSAERGGVVRLAELQAQGYVYLRP
ncbi:MAG: DsrE family protein [Methylobacteriaceae bacterium]|nr:DsrE family protein [Methylobacteriaceae bacterium]